MRLINTVEIKKDQLANGFLTLGSGPTVIFVMGSCRVVNYVSYLNHYNELHGNKFTIHTLDPFNFNWNERNDRVDYTEALKKMETNGRMLDMLKSVNIFIHEFYKNAGMFNCDMDGDKTIFDFGMKAELDICLPNFNDYFILFGDILTFDTDMRRKAMQDFNVLSGLSDQVKAELKAISEANMEKFFSVCRKSDVPEMEVFFKSRFRGERLFWSYNHTARPFTLAVMYYINRILLLDLSCIPKDHADIFANNYTRLCQEDVDAFGYEWGEELVPINNKLFS